MNIYAYIHKKIYVSIHLHIYVYTCIHICIYICAYNIYMLLMHIYRDVAVVMSLVHTCLSLSLTHSYVCHDCVVKCNEQRTGWRRCHRMPYVAGFFPAKEPLIIGLF